MKLNVSESYKYKLESKNLENEMLLHRVEEISTLNADLMDKIGDQSVLEERMNEKEVELRSLKRELCSLRGFNGEDEEGSSSNDEEDALSNPFGVRVVGDEARLSKWGDR